MTPYHTYFYPIFGAGALVALLLSLIAGWRRGCIVPLICLPLGVFGFWAGLFFGADIGYQQWQSMPDPPDEAFADTAPLGALLIGWLPGSVFCGIVFGVTRLIRVFISPSATDKPNPNVGAVNVTRVETSNPYQSPSNRADK